MASTWLGIILIGFFAGLLARLISSNPKDPQGCLMTTFLGILGALLFSWIGQATGMYAQGEYAGFIGAVVGSLLVLGIWRMISGGK